MIIETMTGTIGIVTLRAKALEVLYLRNVTVFSF